MLAVAALGRWRQKDQSSATQRVWQAAWAGLTPRTTYLFCLCLSAGLTGVCFQTRLKLFHIKAVAVPGRMNQWASLQDANLTWKSRQHWCAACCQADGEVHWDVPGRRCGVGKEGELVF